TRSKRDWSSDVCSSDLHIRTALHDAQYEALLINRNDPKDETVTIAGKLCESGDIIIKDAQLPSTVKRGDYLAILSTGAYHYSMRSEERRVGKERRYWWW